MAMSNGGKGSTPRPFSVSNEDYTNRWDAIFGKDKTKEEPIGKPLKELDNEKPTED